MRDMNHRLYKIAVSYAVGAYMTLLVFITLSEPLLWAATGALIYCGYHVIQYTRGL